MLLRESFDEALAALRETLLGLVPAAGQSPVQEAGMRRLGRGLAEGVERRSRGHRNAGGRHGPLRAGVEGPGTSPRSLNAVVDDLAAMAYLILSYEAPRGRKVLQAVDKAPWEYEFGRKWSDSPALVARYRRTTGNFARFLARVGLSEPDE